MSPLDTPKTLEAALEWASKSALKDDAGIPTVVYHGSPDPHITQLRHGTTAYGIFATPDADTAAYYAPGAGRVYTVLLNIERLADLDGPEIFDAIAREAIDYTESRDEDAVLRFGARLYDEGYAKHSAVTRFFDQIPGAAEICAEYDAYDLLTDERTDVSEIEDLVREINQPHVTEAFNKAAPLRAEELQHAGEAYGSQRFYLEYQDNFMRAAGSLGYDGVVFTDPSSTGESISYVVFDPSRIVIIDERLAEELQESTAQSTPKRRPGM